MKRTLVLQILLFTVMLTYSQSKELKGVIIDIITKKSVPFATIGIYNQSELVDGVSADENGEFELIIDKIFTHIEISFIGYKTSILNFTKIENLNKLTILLIEDTTALEEVLIKGKQTTTRLKIDRKIINFGSDIQQSGVNALEAFDHISEVETDITSNTISLRGSSNVRVLINGKMSSLNSVELLQQISVSSIDRIEIITSPSVKYKADGISGIINVILKKNKELGLNSKLFLGTGTGRYNFGFNGNYSLSSVNFRFNMSKSSSETTDNQTILREFNDGSIENIFTSYQFEGDIYKISSDIDFYIKSKHEFSFEIYYTDDSHSSYNKSEFYDLTDGEDYQYLRENTHSHYITNFNSNYRFKFDGDKHFLELDYNVNNGDNNYPIMDSKDGILISDQFLIENFLLQSLALDYTLPIKDKFIIETGISRNTQKLDSENRLILTDNTSTNNKFEYNETLLGVYFLSKFSIDKVNFQVGLRYEHFESNSVIKADHFSRYKAFSNLFTSVHISYPANDNNTFNLGYSKRISRPNFHHVNAFQVVNPLFTWIYNPDINPDLSDNIEFGYQGNFNKLKLGITSFYRHRKNVILWTEYSEDNNQIFTYKNSGVFNSYGIETMLTYRLSLFWNSRLTFNYYSTKINKNVNVSWHEMFSSNIQFKNTFTISNSLTADIVYIYNPKRQRSFSYVESRNRLDLSINGQFLKKRLSASLRLVDIFDNNILKTTSKSDNLTQKSTWHIQSQRFNVLLSLSYKLFKNNKKTRNRKSRRYNKTSID